MDDAYVHSLKKFNDQKKIPWPYIDNLTNQYYTENYFQFWITSI